MRRILRKSVEEGITPSLPGEADLQ